MKTLILAAQSGGRVDPNHSRSFKLAGLLLLSFCLGAFTLEIAAQLPEPGPVRSVKVPIAKESTLKNGLTVSVIEKKTVPLVTVQLLIRNGSKGEGLKKAGLANLTASMLTKGTKTRSATQIAEEIEFLGGNIFSNAGWENSSLGLSITSDKLEQALAILSDIALNPSFEQSELELEKSQTLDALTANLSQPGFLSNYIASRYSYGEHPTGGTPESIRSITRNDVVDFFQTNYLPGEAVLIFVGDITPEKANAAAEKYFGKWAAKGKQSSGVGTGAGAGKLPLARILVVDLPDSGQASVSYLSRIGDIGRTSPDYYTATVLNSLLGGGYSSRLNQEIRIKRGLSYGAGSNFSWRGGSSNFGARTQTKNESAAEVAELMMGELKRLNETTAADDELGPRKSVLTGGFGRSLETNQGIAGALADLYTFGFSTDELNSYISKIDNVKNSAVKDFAAKRFVGGDILIVGDYAKFKDDLAKRFPERKIEVIKADEIDLESPTLRKSDIP